MLHSRRARGKVRTLLNRAEQSDVAVVQSARSEVIYQKVRITTSEHATERAIYRDPQKKRRPKQQHLSSDDQWLKDKLNLAGVNWDEPLSAANYREWHDRQRMKQDVVTRKGGNLLTLTTSVGEGAPVLKESLTVRESDFHPVDRTIELRDMGTVEIAELNYDVMPWGAVDPNWFELITNTAVSGLPTGPHATIHLPHVVSDLELDEAELVARTVLNQLHADTGEQIGLVRAAAGIDVKGVVDTNARKKELVSRLVMIPNVHASILSSEEIESHLLSNAGPEDGHPTEVYSVYAQTSPLQQYLREKNLPEDQLVSASDNLLDGSLRIIQLGLHLAELESRFRGANQLSTGEQAQLEVLYRSYAGSITADIYANKQILLPLGFVSPTPVSRTPESDEPESGFDDELRRYRQLCQEMVNAESGRARPASVIASEILDVGEQIRLRLVYTSLASRSSSNQ